MHSAFFYDYWFFMSINKFSFYLQCHWHIGWRKDKKFTKPVNEGSKPSVIRTTCPPSLPMIQWKISSTFPYIMIVPRVWNYCFSLHSRSFYNQHRSGIEVSKLHVRVKQHTVTSRVLTCLVYKHMQAFLDYLWRGFLILMYCDLLTISWFPN